MRRRAFLRNGLLALGAPAVLSTPHQAHAFLTPRQRRQDGDPIRLSSNENPLGIPPASAEAILGGLDQANRYPGTSRRALTEAVAERHGVPTSGVVLGNGSAEILQMGVQSRLDPALRLVAPSPTFEQVFRYSQPHPWIDLRAIPLETDYAHDLTAMEEAASGAQGPVLVYVCNPNNPTGSLTSVDDVEAWIKRAPDNVHFLVDEAYFEFVDSGVYRSLDKVAWENPNVVVARTFSKVYGMAGLRLGYGIAHPETARWLQAFASGTNCNHLALVAGLAALRDGDWVEKSVASNAKSRQMAYDVLDELGLDYLPSHTNFVMHRISGEVRQYIDRMAEAGIRVGRPFPPMLDYNRLSFGLPEEMERHAETLREFRRRGWV
jgi:histidinol-phosphate aminotransferase